MGGTKCCFRDCPVGSSRNPSMHFFKFPVKDPKRLKDWVRNCSNPDVSNAPPSKLAAKTVCARHFRAECFMNYKMDRLIPMQTPTLFRINRDLALDYADLDQNGEALLVKLTPPKQQHLIPPKDFECPLGFVDGETQNVEVVKKRNTVELTEEEEQRKGKDEADEVSGNLHVLGTEQEQAVVPKEKATAANKSSSSTSASAMPQNILDIISQLQPSLGIKLIKRPVKSQPGSENELPQLEEQLPKEQTDEQTTKESEKHNKSTSCIIDVYRPIKGTVVRKRGMQEADADRLIEEQSTKEQTKKRKLPQESQKTDSQAPPENGTILNRCRQLQEKFWDEQKTPKLEKPTQSIQINLSSSNKNSQSDSISETLSESFLNLEETMPLSTDSEDESEPDEKPSSSEDAQRDKLLQQYDKLQAEFEKLSEENAKLKRLQAESTKTSAPIKPAAASLSKPQLYMAIKKYVGPTMAALLRMEMFGGSEDRTWKDDEREFAIELLQLGEEVYKYCCDEWRFRLPSMRIARSWLEKKNTENSEEFLDL
ncbi:uncharacterized protein LOC6736588 isoform X2 [Drosophila simulans]|uniref:Uncharacterized protein, isoform B n=2 Tax=Drosophila simulans TaxID=7240 RepID=A0A0J9RMZ8_DROSI|nr:uncharacterized protein LOC6736588 isoform X2 [Drosophila simulans]KMY97291.1 uncharacterized protein Dsimw501_GD13349, isoform B [Drosophila simulans]